MNITFLIGNGFDIGLGLKTKYSDFLEEYLNEEAEEPILKFKKEIQENIKQWSDFEIQLGKHAKGAVKDEYLAQFEDFLSKFADYLEKQEKRISFSDETSIAELMCNGMKNFRALREDDAKAISSVYDTYSNQVITYSFISFNYTRCLDKMVMIAKKRGRLSHINKNASTVLDSIGGVYHVHGYVDENMIIGVNDEEQIDNDNFINDLDITRVLIKPRANIEARMGYDTSAKNIINNSKILCIYGMSLGATDKKWWDLISSWLAAAPDRHLVILAHNSKVSKRILPVWIRKTDEVRSHFLSFSSLSQEKKELITKRIHIEFNHDIFEKELRLAAVDMLLNPMGTVSV